ncbi:uncharacterized protein LOC132725390 [Ruditapes philippinarum]|uniref:uncharacterized protein LOC132725390 n=1 Tax=Ruditapes philippinarum TaxID=129788 RepID=UPI00295A8D6E|nr:uncharacterized protein LOC132725390 [Ruditapes philippinarum]
MTSWFTTMIAITILLPTGRLSATSSWLCEDFDDDDNGVENGDCDNMIMISNGHSDWGDFSNDNIYDDCDVDGLVIDCYTTTVDDYTGHQQRTKNGTSCIRWDWVDDYDYLNKQFNDVTVSDAANFCRAVGKDFLWCWTSNSGGWDKCGIEKCVNNGISKCGNLKIEQPALVGRNVTFTFTPDSHDQDAVLEWQRATETKRHTWYTRPLTYKFIQYNENGTYYMVLTNSVPKGDELYYRIHYFNESMHCWMEAGKLELDDRHNNPCGFVYLRTKCVLKYENVYLEYYPSKDVMENPEGFERQWVRSKNRSASYINIKLGDDIYFENIKENGIYTLTVANSRMNGHYGVYCGKEAGFTNNVSVAVQVPPSDIKLEIKFYSVDPLRMYAVCTLKNSNSVCRANFTASNDIIGSEKNSSSMCLPHGAWKTEYVINLNISQEDNGTYVTCAADCAYFKGLVLRDTKTIQLPYRPVIKFNISRPMLSITKGERAHVKCVADSVPASNISWIELTDKEDKIKKQCDYQQECVLDVNADAISKQHFVCAIRYLKLSNNKTLIVNIYKSSKQDIV